MRPPSRAAGAPPGRVADGSTRRAAVRAVEDLQGAAPDLGWPEATGLADGLVDALSHLLVDLADGAPRPSPQPLVVGAIGGAPHPVDHASCRAAAAALRRATAVLDAGAPTWGPQAGQIATALADLLEHAADRERAGRTQPGDKSVLLRRLHELHRRLRSLG